MKIQIAKLDAARRQLNTALNMLFKGGDVVSIHTLSFAAFNITRNVCDQEPNHPESMTTLIKQGIKDEYQKQVWQKINEAGNFFKHADHDPQGCLDYEPENVELYIFMAVRQYVAATKDESNLLFRLFCAYFMIKHPRIVTSISPQEHEMAKMHINTTNPQAFWKDVEPIIPAIQAQIFG